MTIVLLHPPVLQGLRFVRDVYCAGLAKGGYQWPPLDLLMVSGILAGGDAEVRVIDAQAEELSEEETLERLDACEPSYIVFLTSSASRHLDLPFVRRVRDRAPDCHLVMMGDLAVTRPEAILQENPFIDGAILNHFDPGIVDAFTSEGLRPVENMVVRTRDGIQAPGRRVRPRIEIPTPRHDLFPLPVYRAPWARRRWLTTTTTSDGCPFLCTFCTAGLLDYAARPVADVAAEVRFLAEAGAHEVHFQDFNFTVSRRRTLELCEAIAAASPGLSWSCQARVGSFDRPLLEAMRRAGCHTVQLGLESGSDRILEAMRKGFTVRDAEEAVRDCTRAGLRVNGFFILGFPGETSEECDATLRLARRLPLHLASFVLATPCFGTEMVDALERGGTSIDWSRSYDDAQNVLPMSSMDGDALAALRDRAERSFYLRPRQILRILAGVRSLTEARAVLGEGVRLAMPRWW